MALPNETLYQHAEIPCGMSKNPAAPAVSWVMAALIVYRFRQGAQERRLLVQRVTEALYTVLLDFHRARATPLEVSAGRRRLYDAAALRRIYDACRAELVATNEGVPTDLEAVASREAQP